MVSAAAGNIVPNHLSGSSGSLKASRHVIMVAARLWGKPQEPDIARAQPRTGTANLPKVGSGVCRLKANIEARLLERKALFWRLATSWGIEKSFYSCREGVPCRNSTVISEGHLEIGHQWPEKHHLDCFRYSFQFQGWISLFPFLWVSFQNCSSLCHGYHVVII